ncbi:hypothetical protein [Chitinophaga sancti]|uniref:Uncharacterized protein n=1 Tax=Chitinophaga sancti TaxID=1004 RepID=A0A1K1LZ55_9BACT|nr:hypothetical protein [Chitinophaga sancti]WQD64739.1 hypothetical protein U0033_10060 [Chitinophaga sancti]WQG89639.1 hypothetical protein SR876_32415 [Chitinophaga sancti]SFW16138.1 hypothetical protein SAMN05661012_00332 [Chitinophaga sancti]
MNVVQQFNERKQKALQVTKMPITAIGPKWYDTAKIALEYSSCLSLGISPGELKKLLVRKPEDLTMMDFALLSNNLEGKSAKDLGVSIDEYVALLESGAEAVSQWQELSGEIDDQIKKELAEEAIKAKEEALNNPLGSFSAKPAQA